MRKSKVPPINFKAAQGEREKGDKTNKSLSYDISPLQ
jgi:hypothetical protein